MTKAKTRTNTNSLLNERREQIKGFVEVDATK